MDCGWLFCIKGRVGYAATVKMIALCADNPTMKADIRSGGLLRGDGVDQ